MFNALEWSAISVFPLFGFVIRSIVVPSSTQSLPRLHAPNLTNLFACSKPKKYIINRYVENQSCFRSFSMSSFPLCSWLARFTTQDIQQKKTFMLTVDQINGCCILSFCHLRLGIWEFCLLISCRESYCFGERSLPVTIE
jgi:hypothetical protein